jgi:hypothetical protein
VLAQDYAESLRIPIERTSSGDKAAAVTYSTGHRAIRIPKKLDINSEDAQRLIWHELGHLTDQAAHRGGHSQLTSWFQHGRFSTVNHSLLEKYHDYLQDKRPEIEVILRVNHGSKKMSVDQLMSDPDIPASVKESIVSRLRIKEADFRRQATRYTEQDVEVFADGFAKYMMHRAEMTKSHPELAALFEKAAAGMEPDPENRPVIQKKTYRVGRRSRLRTAGATAGLGGVNL